MQKIHTTINPDVELEVGDEELADLTAFGLVLETQATTPAGLTKAAEKQLAENQKESGN